MFKTSLIAAGAAALMLPAIASAQSPVSNDLTVTGPSSDTRYSVVSLADLDLRQDRDVRVADARVSRAAAKVCAVGRANGSAIEPRYDSCYQEAFSTARVDLNGIIVDQRTG